MTRKLTGVTMAFYVLVLVVGQAQAGNLLPDVMGHVAVLDESSGKVVTKTYQTDDFTVMPGWPIQVSGYNHEGGIYYNVDADDDLELICYYAYQVHVFNLDGSYVPGWPQSTTYYGGGAPALGDIDGDGDPEIVVKCNYGMTEGMIYAFELDGTVCSGFPINHGYSSRTPVLADLDGDGDMEIITNKRFWPLGEWWVYDGDGSVYPGWPQPIGHVPSSSSAVGDINGDGIPEIVGESYDALYVWDINGNLLPGFPFYMPYSATNSYSSPVLADLDGDGLKEIIFGTHILGGGGYVFVLNEDGSQAPGWPKYTNYWIYSPPAVGYIDGDDVLDVAVGDQVLSGMPVDQVYAWDANGNPLPGFPIGPIWAVNNQIALADLDGDGMTELLFDDNTSDASGQGKYWAYNHDGTLTAGFPLITNGSTFFNMTCLTDVDNDGYLDLIGAGSSASGGWTNIYIWQSDTPYDPTSVTVPCFQYNIRHDGVPVFEFTPPDLVVTLTPINPPIVIPASGGSFDFTAEIENAGPAAATFDAWIEADLPTGGTVSPIILREDLWLESGWLISRDLTQNVPGAAPTGTYSYRLAVGSYPNTVYASDEFTFYKEGASADGSDSDWTLYGWDEPVSSSADQPVKFGLSGNHPNPFNPETSIRFTLGKDGHVNLTVYDLSGRRVAELVNGFREAGSHEITFNGSGLPSGIYFYRLTVKDHTAVGKMLLVK